MVHMANQMTKRGLKMLKTKKGFTLVEVIIAIALIGIIATGILPVFGTQLKMMINTRKITTTSFDAQGAIEDEVQKVKELLRSPEKSTEKPTKIFKNFFGRDVTMHEVSMKYPLNDQKKLTVYLSGKLAEMEYRNPLEANLVRIDEEKTDGSVNPDIIKSVSVRAGSNLKNVKGVYEIKDYTSSQDLNIYRWYRSKEGISNPKYPDDFEFVDLWRNKKSITKYELEISAANRYIILVLIPVDKSGVRGDEKSSQMVYVEGEDWRSGIFAWIDKNLDGLYVATNDIALQEGEENIIKNWILLKEFDTQIPFQNPIEPLEDLDAKDGSLYVPMGVRRTSIVDESGKIEVIDSEFINWKVAKSIHFANNIHVNNNSDVNMETTDGTIRIYQFADVDSKGAKLEANNINLTAGDKWGSIILDPFTELKSTVDTKLTAAENITIDKSTLNAGGNITLSSNKTDSVDNIIIKDTNINAGQLVFDTSGTISGGSWSESTKVVVKNGKTLKISGLVDNKGAIWLGDTGGISFENNMSAQLKKAMNLFLLKSSDTTVLISNDYGRNVGYADYSEPEQLNSEGVYQYLGNGQKNLKYKASQISGDGTPDIYYSFNGTNTISISAEKKPEKAYNNYYELGIGDKYVEGVNDTIIFKVSAAAGENPVVEIIGSTMPTVKVTFDANGGTFNDGSAAKAIQIEDGKPLNNMPENPKMTGFEFVGWNTKFDGSGTVVNSSYAVSGDMKVYAQWIKVHTVRFDANNGSFSDGSEIKSIKIEDGKILKDYLPAPPTRSRRTFNGWYTKKSNGTEVNVNINIKVTSDMIIYARWNW